jgi:VCBS repeat-containing protein
LNFLGPISLETGKSGTTGSMPPTLASGLAISYTDRVTVTFPVTVSYGLISGTQLINTAAVNASEMITPALASATISVQNAAPLAVDDGGTGFGTDKSTPITTTSALANDSDPNGDALTISSLDTGGTKGLVMNNGNGTFAYDPNGQFDALEAGEQASDTFYTVSDGHGGSDTASVIITIYGELARFIYLPLIIR